MVPCVRRRKGDLVDLRRSPSRPRIPNVVYAGTGDPYRATYRGNGIYKSTDAGKTWRHLPLGDSKVPAILVDPKDPNLVIAAALGNVQEKSGVRGVFRSTDGGATWTRTLFVDDETGVEDVAAAFDQPNVVFAVTGRYYTPASASGPASSVGGAGAARATASTSTGAVFKSTDEGQTWTRVTGTGLPLTRREHPHAAASPSRRASEGASACFLPASAAWRDQTMAERRGRR